LTFGPAKSAARRLPDTLVCGVSASRRRAPRCCELFTRPELRYASAVCGGRAFGFHQVTALGPCHQSTRPNCLRRFGAATAPPMPPPVITVPEAFAFCASHGKSWRQLCWAVIGQPSVRVRKGRGSDAQATSIRQATRQRHGFIGRTFGAL
jgi:hypothetical protein